MLFLSCINSHLKFMLQRLQPKLVLMVVFALFVSLNTEFLVEHTAYASEELVDELLVEVSEVPSIEEVPPPLTYEDVYGQWLTLESGLMRLADRLTLSTDSAQEAHSVAVPSERMALLAQRTLASGNIDGAAEMIAQAQDVLDSAHRTLDEPLEDPSFIPIPAQQIFDASAPEQIALAFREKQNALNFFDQFERELMSSLSLSLLPNKTVLP